MCYIVFQAITHDNDLQFTLQLTYVRLYNTDVGQVLAHDIPLVDVNPESYLERTDCSFSLQTPEC